MKARLGTLEEALGGFLAHTCRSVKENQVAYEQLKTIAHRLGKPMISNEVVQEYDNVVHERFVAGRLKVGSFTSDGLDLDAYSYRPIADLALLKKRVEES